MHKKWNTMIQQQKQLQQKLKNTKTVSEYFKDQPEVGYMRDNLTGNMVVIADAKTSTLRRWTKVLKKWYALCQTPEERKIVNDKLVEVNTELNKRPDANIEKTED